MHTLKIKYCLLPLFIIALCSCGGGGSGGGSGGGGSTSPSLTPVVSNSAKQDISYAIDLSSASVPVTSVSISNGPTWLTFNSTTKKIEGTPTTAATFNSMTFDATFSDGSTKSYGPYSLVITDDPLKQYQWNLKNSGQSGFSSSTGTSGMDINVEPAHSSGVVGSSSIWLVVSDGRIDLNHEDLTDNSDLTLSRNYTLASPYIGNPTSSDDDDYHGTAVASIMASVGWNNKGIRGVCPSCKLIGYNFIDSDQTVSKQISQASSSAVYAYNYSYGSGTCQFAPVDSSYISQVRSTTLNGRSSKGSLFVTSAGNDYSGNGGGSCNFTYLGNSNLDQSKSYPYFIVAAAVDAQGFAATYSTPGANLWVSAPGGEGGQTKPGLFATDIEGCTKGHSKTGASENQFESNSNSMNANCKYTSTATGTSFASPTVAGLVGLLFSANSSLTWRDVKHILASTSKQVQPSSGTTAHPLGYNLSGHTYQQGWVTNTAGYKFHNWYGFGLIDAGAAVAMSKNYSSTLGTLTITEDPKSYAPLYSQTGLSIPIPDNSATGASNQIYVRHNLKVEALQITLNIDHTASSDLGVELTSPSGTKSILMNINSGITTTSIANVTLLSNAFYGETSLGNWTLKVVDGAAADTGTIKSWSIKAWGGKVSNTGDAIPPNPITSMTGPNYFMSLSASPKFSWTASSSGDLLRYEYCVGTSTTDCSLYSWTGASIATTAQAAGMFLTVGNTYFFNVRAIDSSENISTAVSRSWINDDGGTWTLTSTTNAPSPKLWSSAVWSGTEAIIVGGFNSSFIYETHRYNKSTNTWTVGAAPPTYFSDYASVWTGTEMLNWSSDNFSVSALKVYNPTSNTWSVATNTGSPNNYNDASMVWTGSLAIVWGGGFYSNTGSRYNRSGNSWSTTSTTSVPTARNGQSSVWTGTQMIVWGGLIGSSNETNTGGKYNPSTNTWSSVSTVNAPTSRYDHGAVWTGTEMIIWGGYSGEMDGGRYNPSTDTWTPISTVGAPSGCEKNAVWSGSKLFVAGCNSGYGAMYDVSSDTWQLIKPPSTVRPSFGQVLMWVGDRLLLWGGDTYTSAGATYVP